MQIALTGATGSLGGVALAALEEAGHSVRTLGRTPVGTDFAAVELTDAEDVASALSGVDWLVHAAGKIDEDSDLATNSAMAAAIASAATAFDIPVINFSSLSVYGAHGRTPVDEVAERTPVTEYGRSKLAAEAEFGLHPVRVCHLRIGNVYAPDTYDALAENPLMRLLKSGECTNLVFATDVGDVVCHLVGLDAGQLPGAANVVRPGIGNSVFADAFVATGHRRSRGPVLPVALPHAARRLKGHASLPGDARFVNTALERIGFRYRPLDEVAPASWNLPRSRQQPDLRIEDLRILHVTDSIDPRIGGGTATRTMDVATELAARGARCTVLSTRPRSAPDSHPHAGVPSVPSGVDAVYVASLLQRFYLPGPGLRHVRPVLKNHDVVHLMGHWSLLNVRVARLAKQAGVPYVICPAGALQLWGRSRAIKRLFNILFGRRVVRAASGWIAVVKSEIGDFTAHGIDPMQVTIIPNGVDMEPHVPSASAIETTRSQLGLPRDYVLFLGRMNPIKGPDLLLDAFLASAAHVPYDLVLAGPDTGLLESLVERARGSEFADRVHFPGFVSGVEKEHLLAGCRALVVPSRKEAMSVVVLEAGAYGRPVIATTECGLDELLGDGAGWLVPPDVDGLTTALLELAERPQTCRATQLEDRIRSWYGWDVVSELYRNLYSGLVTPPAPSTAGSESATAR